MTEQEYTERLARLEKEHQRAKSKLVREYALINNPYKVGDVLEDHYHTIKVEAMIPQYSSNGFGEMLYVGVDLKKDLTPKKTQTGKHMYQENVKRKIK